jgi:hypothetical protein
MKGIAPNIPSENQIPIKDRYVLVIRDSYFQLFSRMRPNIWNIRNFNFRVLNKLTLLLKIPSNANMFVDGTGT